MLDVAMKIRTENTQEDLKKGQKGKKWRRKWFEWSEIKRARSHRHFILWFMRKRLCRNHLENHMVVLCQQERLRGSEEEQSTPWEDLTGYLRLWNQESKNNFSERMFAHPCEEVRFQVRTVICLTSRCLDFEELFEHVVVRTEKPNSVFLNNFAVV